MSAQIIPFPVRTTPPLSKEAERLAQVACRRAHSLGSELTMEDARRTVRAALNARSRAP